MFDGFLLLCHSDPPSVPQFEYIRDNVLCKIQFVPEDLPAEFCAPSTDDAARAKHFEAIYLLQRYLFHQLLGIQPWHLLLQNSSFVEGCTDYHLLPRFIAINGPRIVNKHDLDAPNRMGFARGKLLSIDQVLGYLEATSKFTAAQYLAQFDHEKLIDCIVSARVEGQPMAFRVDELQYQASRGSQEPEDCDLAGKDSSGSGSLRKEVAYLKHAGRGAEEYDGSTSKKKIRKWKEIGDFLQVSPRIENEEKYVSPAECHLTGLRSDVFELGSVMPMVLKFIRHCNLLTSFDETMGLRLRDKALLRQAFTHASYVDVGMQHVNTVEATISRVRMGYVFEHSRRLKRSRESLEHGGDDIQHLSDQHLKAHFKQAVHSKFLCPYERLEFLGDAVLSFLVASSTFLKCPDAKEGDLHQYRVDIANNVTLGKIAKAANFESLLLTAFDLTKLNEYVVFHCHFLSLRILTSECGTTERPNSRSQQTASRLC